MDSELSHLRNTKEMRSGDRKALRSGRGYGMMHPWIVLKYPYLKVIIDGAHMGVSFTLSPQHTHDSMSEYEWHRSEANTEGKKQWKVIKHLLDDGWTPADSKLYPDCGNVGPFIRRL